MLSEAENTKRVKSNIPENFKVCQCTNIYSNEILSSQTTSTYLYILLCNRDSTNQSYITFNVDVNHYSSLDDQKKDWEKVSSFFILYSILIIL